MVGFAWHSGCSSIGSFHRQKARAAQPMPGQRQMAIQQFINTEIQGGIHWSQWICSSIILFKLVRNMNKFLVLMYWRHENCCVRSTALVKVTVPPDENLLICPKDDADNVSFSQSCWYDRKHSWLIVNSVAKRNNIFDPLKNRCRLLV